VRLNIACGPNMFASANWINYDRVDMRPYLTELKGFKSTVGMPEHQRRLFAYLSEGGEIDFRVRDVREGFPMHESGSIDAIYLGQMIEHLNPLYEAPKLIAECRRMLKPGGFLKITTPDLDLLINAYKNGDMAMFTAEQPEFYKHAPPSAKLAFLMYGASGPNCTWDNYEGHMFLYTRESMTELLSGAGFAKCEVNFYREEGMSRDIVMAEEAVDAGMSHSFATEVVAS